MYNAKIFGLFSMFPIVVYLKATQNLYVKIIRLLEQILKKIFSIVNMFLKHRNHLLE